jgi:hypothetical protein
VERLGPSHPRHIWAQRFGRRLLELQPLMSAHAAVKAAVDAFNDWSYLEPEEAVGRFLVEQDLQDD